MTLPSEFVVPTTATFIPVVISVFVASDALFICVLPDSRTIFELPSVIFTVTVFVLPLYVPTAHLYFNYGHRLRDNRGCEKWWNIEEPDLALKLLDCIQREGLPFLERVQEPSQLISLVERLPGNTNPHSLEAIAYSLAITDNYACAQVALDRLLKVLDVNIGWQAEMMERATQFAEVLTVDPQAAKGLLVELEQTTVKNLGL